MARTRAIFLRLHCSAIGGGCRSPGKAKQGNHDTADDQGSFHRALSHVEERNHNNPNSEQSVEPLSPHK